MLPKPAAGTPSPSLISTKVAVQSWAGPKSAIRPGVVIGQGGNFYQNMIKRCSPTGVQPLDKGGGT